MKFDLHVKICSARNLRKSQKFTGGNNNVLKSW
jgi:hypothetical protein